MRINSLVESSRANGPGARFVIWLQGCEKRCPGCFNKGSHDLEGGETISIDELVTKIEDKNVTFSGGEPLLQMKELEDLILKLPYETTYVLFTGLDFEELTSEHKIFLAKYIDLAVVGSYDETKKVKEKVPLISSYNQIYLYGGKRKYTFEDLQDIPEIEIIIDKNGNQIRSGIGW